MLFYILRMSVHNNGVLCAKVTWLSILFMQPQVIKIILLHNIAVLQTANTRTLFYILLRAKLTWFEI